jgi:hypothetical protein
VTEQFNLGILLLKKWELIEFRIFTAVLGIEFWVLYMPGNN